MPAKDGTGPLGEGPGTGRGFGSCVEQGVVTRPRRRFLRRRLGFSQESVRGRGFRQGRGFGFRAGLRQPVYESPEEFQEQTSEKELSEEDEKQALESELKQLESEKQEIEKRLKELESLDKKEYLLKN
ncbi:MAG: DUF5320 domain-containing protein [Minisyncoccales bacterium]